MNSLNHGEISLETSDIKVVFINDHYQPTFLGLSATLKQAGYNVIGSSSSDEIDEILRSHNADCAVLDLDAPDRSLPAAHVFMRKDVPIIFLGGIDGEDLGIFSENRRFNKPISPQELLAEVETMLKKVL